MLAACCAPSRSGGSPRTSRPTAGPVWRACARSPTASHPSSPRRPAPDRRLRPGGFRRQAHEDRLDVAAGLQAEPGAAVVEQVELGVAAAAEELVAALLLGPGLRHVAAHQGGIDLQDRSEEHTSELQSLMRISYA